MYSQRLRHNQFPLFFWALLFSIHGFALDEEKLLALDKGAREYQEHAKEDRKKADEAKEEAETAKKTNSPDAESKEEKAKELDEKATKEEADSDSFEKVVDELKERLPDEATHQQTEAPEGPPKTPSSEKPLTSDPKAEPLPEDVLTTKDLEKMAEIKPQDTSIQRTPQEGAPGEKSMSEPTESASAKPSESPSESAPGQKSAESGGAEKAAPEKSTVQKFTDAVSDAAKTANDMLKEATGYDLNKIKDAIMDPTPENLAKPALDALNNQAEGFQKQADAIKQTLDPKTAEGLIKFEREAQQYAQQSANNMQNQNADKVQRATEVYNQVLDKLSPEQKNMLGQIKEMNKLQYDANAIRQDLQNGGDISGTIKEMAASPEVQNLSPMTRAYQYYNSLNQFSSKSAQAARTYNYARFTP